MAKRFLLYGATGYTGGLITRQAIAQGLQPILAGRNAGSLAPLATELGVEYRVFALDDAAGMDVALTEVAAVLNCAGPFVRTAAPLVAGCLRGGIPYLDLAGEVPDFEALLARDAEAHQAGTMLMPGVGFGIVPTDCLAAHLKQRLPSANHLTLAFEAVGGLSQGTASTLFRDLHKPGVVRRDGELHPAWPAAQSRAISFCGTETTSVTLNPWRGDLATAYRTTGIPTIETYTAFPAPVRWLMAASPRLGTLWASQPMQDVLGWAIAKLPVGPDEATLAKGYTRLWAEVRDDAGTVRTTRLTGPEAYRFTALTALAVVARVLAGEQAPGFQTPAGLYGADFILNIPGIVRVDLNE